MKMSIRLINLRKKAAMFLAIIMLFSLVSIPVAFAADPEAVASWDYTAAPSAADVPSTGGALSEGAVLSNFKAAVPTYSSGSLSTNGWDSGADTKYWQLSLSTAGYDNLTLAAKTRSSGTGPRDFKVVYSLDSGSTWADVPEGSYSITGTTLSNFMPALALPAETADAGSLLIRFIMTSNISSRAGTGTYAADEPVAAGGTSNINNIAVTGTPIGAVEKVTEVTADPVGGAVAAGSKVTLACGTEGVGIMYSINGGEYQAYDPAAQVTLGALPAILTAYGVKDGMSDGDVSTWEYTAAIVPEKVAAWDITAVPAGSDVPATSGASASAVLGNFRSITPGYSSGSLSINGWDNGSGSKYWQLSLSTAGYKDLTLAAKTRSSGTGPRDFKVVYSTDGGAAWADVPGSDYAITGTTLSYFMPTISLPSGAANKSSVLLRFIMTSNISSRAGTGTYAADEPAASGGTSNINNVVVIGTPTGDTAAVAGITAAPAGGAVAEGSGVSLSCSTEDAAIMYSLGDAAFQAYDPAAGVTLTALPVTLRAYGVKDGMLDGEVSSWDFAKANTAAVTASPGSGAIRLGSQVTLACVTPGAQIKYSLDSGATWNDYTSSITLSALPASIRAYAVAAGFGDGEVAAFDYTERTSNYSIYFGQLHSHTTNSDGIGSLDDAYSYAKNMAGVDFLAVTDHSNSFDNGAASSMADGSASTKWANGHTAADKYTDGNFVGIYGYEMTWSNGTGHMNTFNTPGFETRENQIFKNADGLQQYYNILKQFPQSISQLNHPGTTFGDFNDFAGYDPVIDQRVTLVEVGNGEGAVRTSGYFPSYDYYTRALDKGWHLAPANNQDNHMGKWGNANTARTVILADSLTRDNIYDAIKNMRVYATEDNNLEITYTLNGQVMGTILPERPAGVDISVSLHEPDSEALGIVSVISNGGRVVASQTLSDSDGTVHFELSPDYSYYYIRVDEADGDIAVTAPVWIDEVEKAGIDKTTSSTALPVKGQPMTITTSLYNNESAVMNITALEYSAGGSVIHTASSLSPVNPLGTGTYSFNYTPEKAGKFDINVTLTATIDGVEKTFTDVLKLNVVDPAVTTKIVVDASHFNDYVSGYYSGNMTNLIAIANQKGMSVVMQTTPLTSEALSGAQLLVLSAPAKKSGTAGGVSYTASPYTDDELAVIQNYAANGGNIIVTSLADYQDSRTVTTDHSAYQQNRVLEAIGAQTRINDDEVIDYDNNPNVNPPGVAGGTPYRIPMGVYNTDSPYLSGVVADQRYSFYSGCSITMGVDAAWLVKGWPSTYGFDSDNDGKGGSYVSAANKTMPADTGIGKGNVVALAAETLSGGGKVFVGGTVFYSNFEVKVQIDNYSQLQNSNYNILMNILESVKKIVPVTPVNEARAGSIGSVYCVEGIVTAGTTPSDNAFFDTIYVQDETGGINIFPVSGADIKVGQKVKVIGTLDQYQGDLELRVTEISITDTSVNPLEPTIMTANEAMAGANGGKLVRVEGTVTRMDSQNLYIDDGSGEARVFLDGYIGDGSGDASKLGKWDPDIMVGDRVRAAGLASVDNVGPRLRVRNTAEIVRIADTVPPVITITGLEDGKYYNTDVTPVVSTNEGTFTMTLNGESYGGGAITAEGRYTLNHSR